MSAAVSLPRRLPLITNSELRTFRRCAREHHFRYRLLRRPLERAEALRFGTLVHLGLEAWWRTDGSASARADAAFVAMAGGDPFELARAEALLIGYTARWSPDEYETLSVEASFDAPLVNPQTGAESRTYRLGGKLDAVARHRETGRVEIIEHKTTSEEIAPGADYWRRVSALDSQVSLYHVGARALGHDVAWCTYDVLRKPQQRPLKATPVESRRYTKSGALDARQREHDETADAYRARVVGAIQEAPDKYYARGTVVRLANDEAEAALDTWHTARLVREAEIEERYPRNPDACLRFGRECDYFGCCSGEASIDDDGLFRTASSAHEELESVEEIRSA